MQVTFVTIGVFDAVAATIAPDDTGIVQLPNGKAIMVEPGAMPLNATAFDTIRHIGTVVNDSLLLINGKWFKRQGPATVGAATERMDWPICAFDLADPLNQEIWEQSPARQEHIFPARKAPTIGTAAATAQALAGSPALPWVPDIVGRHWRQPGGVLVLGAAYADFFLAASRNRSMTLPEYRAADGPAAFQRTFLARVVIGDANYYAPIADLLAAAGVPFERTVISDIVRASFGQWNGDRMVADTATMSLHDSVFQQYVRANLDWHQRRLDEGGFRVIVALGGLAYDEARRFAGRSVRVLKVRHPAAWGSPRTVDAAPALRAALLASNAIVAANLPDFAAKAAMTAIDSAEGVEIKAAEKAAALAAIEPLRVTLTRNGVRRDGRECQRAIHAENRCRSQSGQKRFRRTRWFSSAQLHASRRE